MNVLCLVQMTPKRKILGSAFVTLVTTDERFVQEVVSPKHRLRW